MGIIRRCVAGLGETPILYGGSMNADNVRGYLERSNINGGLVGGASLDPDGFATLIANSAS
jgi:triosephosphate isomerase